MKKIFSLIMFLIAFIICCQKKNIDSNLVKFTNDTIDGKPIVLHFDDDQIKDTIKIIAKPVNKILNFKFSFYLSTLNKTIEIPILNNSILYNNNYSVYYVSDPIIKDKIIEIRVDYPDQIITTNNVGEKQNLIEKIKIRFNFKTKKIQIIGYDLSYQKENKKKYTKSYDFITGKYNSSYYFQNEKKTISGWAFELKNIYLENWNHNFLNKISLYGNEIE